MTDSNGTIHLTSYSLKDALISLFDLKVDYFYEFSVNDMALTLSVDGDNLGHPTYIVLTRVQTSRNTSFEITNAETSDDFETVPYQYNTGTVWVNVTKMNTGESGLGTLQVHLYQGTGNYTDCGEEYFYNLSQTAYLQRDEIKTLHFTFYGVQTHNNTGCYGVYYEIN